MYKKILSTIIASLLLILPFTSVYADKMVSVKKVIAVLTADLNKDGGMDRIVLTHPSSEEDATLYIYLSHHNKMKLAIEKKNIAWVGGLWGTLPSLNINKADSLIIHSENSAIGRNRWEKKLTVSYRKKKLIVSGYTYSSYDTLKPDSDFECDVNLITGRGYKNKKAFKITPQKIPLKNWNEHKIPKQCLEG